MRRLMRLFFFILLVTSLVWGVEGFCADERPDVSRSVAITTERVIAAYGGKEVIEGIRSLHARGKIDAFMRNDHGTYELYFKREKKLRVETKYRNSAETRILNGERGFRGTDTFPPEEVFGPRFLSMLYQYKHFNILHDLVRGTYTIEPIGRSSVRGKTVDVFRLHDKEGAVMEVFVDAQTFFIVKVIAYFAAAHKQIDLSAEFSDFRKVGGSVLPFRIVNYAGGVKVAETVIEKYSLNEDIPDSLFIPSPAQPL